MGTLLSSRLLTVSLVSGSINAKVFSAWLEQDLLPQLPHPVVIVVDNATCHQRADIRQLIGGTGHLLEYLPAYSPNLNPIERNWAPAKALRKPKICSVEELFTHYLT